jgi:hypothetical protein
MVKTVLSCFDLLYETPLLAKAFLLNQFRFLVMTVCMMQRE